MPKEIIAVYQDCVLCGDRGRKIITEFAKKGINIRKVGFMTTEGKDLIHKAVFEHKIGSMPFFTDGDKFDISIDGLLSKIEEKPTKKTKKMTKKIKEADNGADSED